MTMWGLRVGSNNVLNLLTILPVAFAISRNLWQSLPKSLANTHIREAAANKRSFDGFGSAGVGWSRRQPPTLQVH